MWDLTEFINRLLNWSSRRVRRPPLPHHPGTCGKVWLVARRGRREHRRPSLHRFANHCQHPMRHLRQMFTIQPNRQFPCIRPVKSLHGGPDSGSPGSHTQAAQWRTPASGACLHQCGAVSAQRTCGARAFGKDANAEQRPRCRSMPLTLIAKFWLDAGEPSRHGRCHLHPVKSGVSDCGAR